jgi:DNA-binding transcriptional LysR family regulator
LVENAAFRRGFALDQVQQADGVSLTVEMVRNGLGCTVLPYASVRDEVTRGGLAFHPIEHDPLVTVHAIATRGGDGTAPFVAEVRRLLRDTMSGLAKSGAWAGATALGTPGEAACAPAPSLMEAAIE